MSRKPPAAPGQEPLPIQPVGKPILCNPYGEPASHWVYGNDREAFPVEGRRPASYWFKAQRVAGPEQLTLLAEEQREDLPV